MGRKSRFDRRSKGSSYNPQSVDHLPKRGRSRTRSPAPERRRAESPYPRGPRQTIPEATTSRSLSPARGGGYGNTTGYYEARPSSMHARDIPSSPRGRIEDSRSTIEEYRRGKRPISSDRIQNFHRQPRSPRSPSPSSHRETNKHKKSKNKKSRVEKKQRPREKDKHKKSSQRQHDVWKPSHNSDGSPPSGRGRLESSPQRSRSPSPRRGRVVTSGSGREYYSNHPSYGHERHGTWPTPTKPLLPPPSPAHRYPPDERELYQKYPPTEYDRPTSSGHGVHSQSPIPRRYEDYPPTYSKQDYERRDYDPHKQGRPTRPRGQDYNREDWEDAHNSRERYEPQVTEHRYSSNYPEEPRPAHESYEKYPTDVRYPEIRAPEVVARRRTPEGPRAQYEHQYRQQRYPYEITRDPYERPPYPSREENIKPRSSPSYLSQYHDTRYDDGYQERFPESTRIVPPPPPPPPPTLSQETIPPRTTFVPPPPQEPNGFRIDHHAPSVSNAPISAPTAPKPNGGIKPFTLKGNVLKNLKRAHESDLEPERIFKSSRTSPRHVNPTLPSNMPPPPASTIEIQQTETPETPSNRDDAPERRVSTKEKGASVFERIGQVGEGTYGRVYKARNTLTGELVALKKIRMEAERDGFPITAMREIKLLESLRHPNVIHLQEMMFEKTFVYMVFEYMDHDLAGILTHPHFTFTPAQIKELLRQMLEGLHYLHRRGILHRDIKGSNILLNANGQLKLADFGLARHYHKRRDNLDYTNRVITLWYRPPELLLGATAYGPAVDIWSIGCIMLEMFTKKALFPGADELDQLRRIWNIMGSPTMETWPKVTKLPWWELVKPHPGKVETFHADFDGILSEQAIDLASKLLSLDPEQRPTALEALQHPYFTKEFPRPERANGLDEMDGEWHEFESKQRKRAQRALQQELKQASPKH